MKTFKILALAVLFLLNGYSASSQDVREELCHGFLPKNNLRYPVGSNLNGTLGGLNRQQYDFVLDKIEALYSPIVHDMGGIFRLFRDWENPGLTSKAGRGRSEIDIIIYGGLARHPSMTEDGLALVACHEIGHHFGGFPKLTVRMLSWMTIEGQADYFASLKCLRLYFDEASNTAWLKTNGSSVPQLAVDKCGGVYSSVSVSARENERITCLRSTMAGLAVSGVFKEVNKDSVNAQLDTPDPKVVPSTYTGHPGSQCRVDTYFQGALCDRPVNEKLSNTDYRVGSCSTAGGQVIGLRPTCWFSP